MDVSRALNMQKYLANYWVCLVT